MKIMVSNLSYEVDETQLVKLFSAHGAVVSAKIIRGIDDNQSRGVAVVEMGNRADGETAVKTLNRTTYMNQYLLVAEIKTPQQQESTMSK